MKSKKHHKRIYEKRSLSNTSESFNGKKINFVKKKSVIASIQPANKNPIKFVSNSKNSKTYIQKIYPYTTIKTYDLNAAFEQPSLDNVYSSVKSGHVIEYNEYFACDTMKRKNDDSEHNNKFPKLSNFSSVSNSNYNINNEYMNRNDNKSYMLTASSSTLDKKYQENSNSFTSNGYNPNNSQNYNYSMFSNLAMLQYSNAFAAAKKNTK